MIRRPRPDAAARLFEDDAVSRSKYVSLCLPFLALVACHTTGEFDESGGIQTIRSACPGVGIPAYTGDVTLFDPPSSRDARAIDVVATITNVRTTCANEDTSDHIQATATFDVLARRSAPGPARDVVLPYFATVMRGGSIGPRAADHRNRLSCRQAIA